MAIPKNVVSRENILQALAAIDLEGVPWHRESTKFDLVYEQRLYPPKYAISQAFKLVTGIELHGFSGGNETNEFLRKLGFEIREKGGGV